MPPIDPGIAVALGSGVAVGVLGLGVALSGSRRISTFSFAAFLLVWSGLIVAGNLSRLPAAEGNLDASRMWLLVLSSFLIVIYLPLIHFAETFPTERGWFVRTRAGSLLLVAPAVAGGIAMLSDPSLFHAGFREIGGSIQSDWGPLYVVFFTLFTGAFLLLIWRLVDQYRGAVREIERLRARDLLLALGLYLAFQSTETAILFGSSLAAGGKLLQDVAFVALSLVTVALLVWAGREIVRRETRGGRMALATFVLPAAFGVVSALTMLSPAVPNILTRGIWRLVSVAVIAYAVLRYEMFDIEIQAARGVTVTGAFLITVVAGFAVSRLVEATLGSPDLGTLTGLAAAGGILLGLAHRRPGFLMALENRVGTASELDRRRLEVYEAALVRERSREGSPEGRTLDSLRRDLDLTEPEAALLERHVSEGTVGGQAPEPEPGTRVGDRYEIEAPAGAGQTGRAWRAADRRTGQTVVVKMLDRPLTDREALYGFLRESRAARRVDHPNVVALRDMGLHGTHPYLVLDHVPGGSLADRLEKEGPLGPARAAGIVDDVLAGLEALHEANLLHRDVKAENVLLKSDGTAVLADLDLAGPLDPDATVAGLGDLTRAGTPATMSPEVAAGEAATPASDVYAAGALLNLLLTGEPYVDLSGVRPRDLPARIRDAEPSGFPDDVPRTLQAVVGRALRTDPEERYPSAEAMRDALDGAL